MTESSAENTKSDSCKSCAVECFFAGNCNILTCCHYEPASRSKVEEIRARNKHEACMRCRNIRLSSHQGEDMLECDIDHRMEPQFVERDDRSLVNTYRCRWFDPAGRIQDIGEIPYLADKHSKIAELKQRCKSLEAVALDMLADLDWLVCTIPNLSANGVNGYRKQLRKLGVSVDG